MIKKIILLMIVLFPINMFAYQGFSDSKMILGLPYCVFSLSGIYTSNGRGVRASRSLGTKQSQETIGANRGNLSLFSQDFSLPSRGDIAIPGISRSFYHGVDPNTGYGIPWYYAY
ncbi:MAG: hypothetical protein B5M53_02770 [Candidatus Cloacimonas sp. 4484_209]|nr:MAG: hypothetical protein B5M53_02770 [Candidatus Cloacimonas sp. 4484_209]